MSYVYATAFAVATALAGCDGAPAVPGGEGGAPTITVPCASVADCPPLLGHSRPCEAVACDTDGAITDSESPILGCYVESVNFGTACEVGACSGRCLGAFDGGDSLPLTCSLNAECAGGN